jgi:hypothetical protein
MHGDLGVLDAPGGAGVLPLRPDRATALLHVPGLIDHQHRVRIGEMVDNVGPQVRTDTVGIPDRSGQQMLHAVGRGVPGVLRQRPAVLPWQVTQQRQQKSTDPAPALDPAEPAADPIQQLIDARRPSGRSYPGPRDHRGTVRCPHP